MKEWEIWKWELNNTNYKYVLLKKGIKEDKKLNEKLRKINQELWDKMQVIKGENKNWINKYKNIKSVNYLLQSKNDQLSKI